MSIPRKQVGLDSFGRPVRVSDPYDRLMQRVERRGECLVYLGYCNRAGYGWARGYDGKNGLTHRIVWHHYHPDQPMPEVVMHTCDNPPCVKIDHLRGGTHRDNNQDMIAKGRKAPLLRGEQSPKARLTSAQVAEIRERRRKGETLTALALEFGVHNSYLSRVTRNQRRRFDGFVAPMLHADPSEAYARAVALERVAP